MRQPTDDEVEAVLHEASSLDVRSRGRLAVLRIAVPLAVDVAAFRAAIEAGLATTPLAGAQLVLAEDAGEARVLGGVFE